MRGRSPPTRRSPRTARCRVAARTRKAAGASFPSRWGSRWPRGWRWAWAPCSCSPARSRLGTDPRPGTSDGPRRRIGDRRLSRAGETDPGIPRSRLHEGRMRLHPCRPALEARRAARRENGAISTVALPTPLPPFRLCTLPSNSGVGHSPHRRTRCSSRRAGTGKRRRRCSPTSAGSPMSERPRGLLVRQSSTCPGLPRGLQ